MSIHIQYLQGHIVIDVGLVEHVGTRMTENYVLADIYSAIQSLFTHTHDQIMMFYTPAHSLFLPLVPHGLLRLKKTKQPARK